jgi:hypothetical protein
MEPRLQTEHDDGSVVWTTPVLRSLRHASGARTGSSELSYETSLAGTSTYVPLPS